jgi:hypothetical protein
MALLIMTLLVIGSIFIGASLAGLGDYEIHFLGDPGWSFDD